MECMLADDYLGYETNFGCGDIAEVSGSGSGCRQPATDWSTREIPESECLPTTVPYAL